MLTDDSKNIIFKHTFNSDVYLEQFYSDPHSTDESKCQNLFRGQLELLHNAFKKGTIRGHTLLDVGCGPSVVLSIVPSQYFNEVYYCDLLESNIQHIQSWLNKTPCAKNFQPYFNVAAQLLNKSIPWTEGPEILRSKTRGIWTCDLHNDHVIPVDVKPRLYDCILAGLVLGSACVSNEDLYVVVSRLAGLLDTEGHLVVHADIGCPAYSVGECRFPQLVINKENLSCAITGAGLTLVQWMYEAEPGEEQEQGHAVIIAKKQ